MTTSEPNSDGGIDLRIIWKNTSDKTVKYITVESELYNAVNDVVPDTITNNYIFRGEVTAPIEPGTTHDADRLWKNAWWNHSGKYAKITRIEITYMDGTELEIPNSKIE